MPTDAKFGLVVGVSLVIAVAVVFFRKDVQPPPVMSGEPSKAADREPARIPTSDGEPTASRIHGTDDGPARLAVSRRPASVDTSHVIQAGDTLFSIARRYYGDGERFIDLYRANRDLITDPDHLPAGTSIRVP